MRDRMPALDRRVVIEAGVAAVLLALAFSAIAASDVSAVRTHLYWSLLVVVFAAVAFVVERLHPRPGSGGVRGALGIALHWAGVLVAVQLVYLLVASGRMANADTGLCCGLVLALGTFLAGVHGNWRLLVVGAALGAATAGVAFVEEYVWVLLLLALVVIVLLVVVPHMIRRRRGAGA